MEFYEFLFCFSLATLGVKTATIPCKKLKGSEMEAQCTLLSALLKGVFHILPMLHVTFIFLGCSILQ